MSSRNQKIRAFINDGANSSDIGFYFFVLPSMLFPVAFFYIVSLKRDSSLSLIREKWGLPRQLSGEIAKSSFYHNTYISAKPSKHLDEQTWNDLNLTEIFNQLDHTSSAIGQQMLYHILRTPQNTETELKKRDQLAHFFSHQDSLREKIQLTLSVLDTKNAYDLPRLFLQNLPTLSRIYVLFPLGTLLAIGSFCTVPFVTGLGILAPLAVLAFNIVIGLAFRWRFRDFSVPLRSMHNLIIASEKIAQLNNPELADQTNGLRTHCKRLQLLKSASKYLIFDNHFNEVLASAYAYLNIFLLIDLNVYLISIRLLGKCRGDVRSLYEILGMIDAVVSISSYRYSLSSYCTPQFTPQLKQIIADDICHPLLHKPISNSIMIKEKSILVYGANMSGKTTFIRSLGLNAILGQTIYTCLAKSYQAPFINVKSFINRKDDILGGKSYFREEVVSVRELIYASDSAEQHLFLIDELFKGTSPQECTALSHAVLKHLDTSEHMVVVATHDYSLQALMKEWDLFHFCGTIVNSELLFEYKINKGAGFSNNALKLLEVEGYPQGIIETANRTLKIAAEGNFG